MVALADVVEDVGIADGLPLGGQLVEAPLCPDFGRCGHEDLEVGIGEDYGADVAAVHHYAAAAAHLLLLAHHGVADCADGADGAHVLADGQRAYLRLDALSVEKGLVLLGVGIEAERYADAVERGRECLFVDAPVGNQAVAQGVERDGAIHGAGVDVGYAELLGQVFGHGAFAARRVAVDGDDEVRFDGHGC